MRPILLWLRGLRVAAVAVALVLTALTALHVTECTHAEESAGSVSAVSVVDAGQPVASESDHCCTPHADPPAMRAAKRTATHEPAAVRYAAEFPGPADRTAVQVGTPPSAAPAPVSPLLLNCVSRT